MLPLHCFKKRERRYSPSQISDMLLLYTKGVSRKKIAEKYNCDPSLVMKIINGYSYGDVAKGERLKAIAAVKSNSVNKNRKYSQYEITRIRERYKNGEKVRNLAIEYKCAECTMSNIVTRKTYVEVLDVT